MAALWRNDGWITAAAAKQARTHYGAYSILNHYGLRLITLNSDFWYAICLSDMLSIVDIARYTNNLFTYLNTTNPDQSGMLAWLIQELQLAEDKGERKL